LHESETRNAPGNSAQLLFKFEWKAGGWAVEKPVGDGVVRQFEIQFGSA
jgi:hypothetical protein